MMRGVLSRVIGAAVGAELDKRDGSGGLKGAAVGMIAMGAMRRMGPLGMALGAAYVAKKAYDRRKSVRA
ncbi:hypothetical protein [Sphingomonas aracearum]|nr:hypothetical protein [Sphingomonas aracearum]